MAIENTIWCEECDKKCAEDEIVCRRCYQDLEDEIKRLENEISDLERELENE